MGGDKIKVIQEEIEIFHDEEFEKKVQDINRKGKISEKKKELIDELSVTVNRVPFAGDDVSQVRMTSVTALANWHFNKTIGEVFIQQSQNPDLDDNIKAIFGGVGQVLTQVYKGIYKDTKLDWKGSDKQLHSVGIETVAEALEQAMQQVGSLIMKAERGNLDIDEE